MRTLLDSVSQRIFGFVLVALGLVGTAGAQQPNASAAAAGLGGNFTALARGYDAVAWNPANLGLPGNPGFSLSILPLGSAESLHPIGLKDFKDFSGQTIPTNVKQTWLDQVTAKGGEKGAVDGGLSEVALSIGPFAFQVGTSGYGAADMAPDAFEALMFGNAGKTGSVRTLSFQGSSFRAGAFTTVAASYGFRIGDAKGGSHHMAFGVTAKYVIGHITAIAQDVGSQITPDSVNVAFPMVLTDTNKVGNSGSGFGADLGFAWTADKLTFGAAIQNVFNSFSWDASTLAFRPGTARFDINGDTANFDEQPYGAAPAALKDIVANNKFKPTLAAGITYAWRSDVTLTADARQQLSDSSSIVIGPKTQVGGGIEYRGISFLPLRLGLAYVTGGTALSAGFGIRIRSYELGVGGSLRQGDAKGNSGIVSLFSIH